MTTCAICNREYEYDRRKGYTKSKCNSCLANCRKYAILQKCLDYKGGKCQACGYNKCSRALAFHHRNPELKSFGISANHCRKWSVLRNELDKCDLLCSNCHMELHYEEDKFSKFQWKPKTYIKDIKKKCPQCQCDFIATSRKIIYCSTDCLTKAKYVYNKPTRNQLLLLLSTKSYSEVGRMYNCSDNAVRKWAKKYNIYKSRRTLS